MTTDTAVMKTYSMIEVRVELHVPIERNLIEQAYGDPDDLSESQLLDVIMEDTDSLPNALQTLLREQDYAWFDVTYDEDEEWVGPEPVAFSKPDEGGLYTLPIPNFINGNVRFTDEGIEAITESPANVLTDDQLKGAYYAAKRIWGLRGMHRYQQEQIAEFISELQWGMLARPSLHRFAYKDDPDPASLDAQQEPTCRYCGQLSGGHERAGD